MEMIMSVSKLLAPVALALSIASPSLAQQGSPGAHFIENWDADGDGRVSLSEAREKRSDIFTMFDTDEDDVLSSEEYDAFDETRAADMAANAEALGASGKGPGVGNGKGNGRGQGKGQAGPGLGDYNRSMSRDYADTDGNGVVSRSEFEGLSDAWFTQRDRDGDGFITSADFGPRG
ncbi:EF-hand domain-containing protein [Vannielia litorea]|uniref:EF-hand domain-containing protein n=1 Tax=Vannielia litorea TaxID=1217970 RepID=UPI001FD5EF23|nr:EF-hand domain-containing protein [Vannielia litorea]